MRGCLCHHQTSSWVPRESKPSSIYDFPHSVFKLCLNLLYLQLIHISFFKKRTATSEVALTILLDPNIESPPTLLSSR